ncbi:MAG: hypothetical protein WCA14_04160 [Steroidobacteraceae bacterium]
MNVSNSSGAPSGTDKSKTPGLVVTHVVRPRGPRARENGRFVVELIASSMPPNPRKVPYLDLFGLYHLYHHVDGNEGGVRHSLRLGFFNEERTARTIARYAAAYFESPRVAQISAIEEGHSGRHLFRAMKDVGATGQFAAIELTAPKPLPAETRSAPVRSVKAVHPPSLWSRLFG